MPSLLRAMRGRDTGESHRASTPLELFFDLTFVVGVSFAAEGFAHEVASDDTGHGLLVYVMVFFAIWWGWLNFTWFASAYDTDDWLYRSVTLVQMAGALVVAAGVPRAMDSEDFTVVVVGYVIMRLALVFQWLRAARSDPDHRRTDLTYAGGIVVVQMLWVVRLLVLPESGVWTFAVLVVLELAVPVLAERGSLTPFHRGHVAERYGLFTLIVLGEGVLASAKSVVAAVDEGEHVAALVTLAVFGLVVLAGMWWVYFQLEAVETLVTFLRLMTFGYGHYFVFAAAGAVSAGLEVQVEQLTEHSEASELVAGLVVSVPVAVFLLVVWAIVLRPQVGALTTAGCLTAVVLTLAAGFLPGVLLGTGVVAAVVALLVAGLVVGARADART